MITTVSRYYTYFSFSLGINPASLSGANIGVFVTDGITEQENFYSTLNRAGSVYVLGCARTMSPNRLSYAFNLNGT